MPILPHDHHPDRVLVGVIPRTVRDVDLFKRGIASHTGHMVGIGPRAHANGRSTRVVTEDQNAWTSSMLTNMP